MPNLARCPLSQAAAKACARLTRLLAAGYNPPAQAVPAVQPAQAYGVPGQSQAATDKAALLNNIKARVPAVLSSIGMLTAAQPRLTSPVGCLAGRPGVSKSRKAAKDRSGSPGSRQKVVRLSTPKRGLQTSRHPLSCVCDGRVWPGVQHWLALHSVAISTTSLPFPFCWGIAGGVASQGRLGQPRQSLPLPFRHRHRAQMLMRKWRT